MADDFLLIAATGWTELENAPARFHGFIDPASVLDLVYTRDWQNLSTHLEEIGVLPEGTSEIILDARVINVSADGSDYRFWYIRQT